MFPPNPAKTTHFFPGPFSSFNFLLFPDPSNFIDRNRIPQLPPDIPPKKNREETIREFERVDEKRAHQIQKGWLLYAFPI
jgi:hypothetical protein